MTDTVACLWVVLGSLSPPRPCGKSTLLRWSTEHRGDLGSPFIDGSSANYGTGRPESHGSNLANELERTRAT